MRRKYFGLALGLAVIVSLLFTWPAARGGAGFGYELAALDMLFVLRYRVFGVEPLSTDPRVVLVGIDSETFRRQAKPTMFWQADIGAVSQALLDAGAVAVGVDLLVGDTGVEGGLKEARYEPVRGLLREEETGLAVPVFGGKVVLAQYRRTNGELVPQVGGETENILAAAAAAEGNLGLTNAYTDPDGHIRTLPVWRRQDEKGAWTFAFRLLEIAKGLRFEVRGGELYLGPVWIPTESASSDVPALRLNYPGPPDSWGSAFPGPKGTGHAAFWEILESARAGRPLDGFANTICIICFQDPGQQDYHTTPYNLATDRDSVGAEIHAAAINTILTQRFIRRLAVGSWIAISLGLALVVATLGFHLRLGFSLTSAVTLLLGYLGLTVFAFSRHGVWLPVVSPLLAGSLAYGIAFLLRYLLLQSESRRVKQLFGSMVSPQVMTRMLKEPDRLVLGGESRRVTVLFSDINDFTPICERHTPAEIVLMLNSYFAEMIDIVHRHDGNLKQFVGDEIMVIFNAPDNQPDHAARAVMTGIEMIERLAEMKAAAAAEGRDGFFEVKIGINTGNVVVGSVGSEARQEYAAVGDDVNLGARIESLTKKVGAFLLVSESTRREAQPLLPDLEWVSKGLQQFKGKTTQVEVYEVRRKGSQ